MRLGHPLTIVALALFAQCGGSVVPTPVVVLFGGTNDVSPMQGVVGGALGDTWAWNGSVWTQLEGGGPSVTSGGCEGCGRWDAAMARFNDSIVLFGGSTGEDPASEHFLYDTWTLTSNYVWVQSEASADQYVSGCDVGLEQCVGMPAMAQLGPQLFLIEGPWGPTSWWDGTNWSGVNPVPASPGSSVSGVMASFNNALVLFDGSDTWTFDGINWTHLQVVGPSNRAAMAMAALSDTLVLFGGFHSQCLGDTWIFDGTMWTQLKVSGPSARRGASMAGRGDGRLVLFGGVGDDSTVLQDTWVWDGTSWTELDVPGPPARAFAAMAGL